MTELDYSKEMSFGKRGSMKSVDPSKTHLAK